MFISANNANKLAEKIDKYSIDVDIDDDVYECIMEAIMNGENSTKYSKHPYSRDISEDDDCIAKLEEMKKEYMMIKSKMEELGYMVELYESTASTYKYLYEGYTLEISW